MLNHRNLADGLLKHIIFSKTVLKKPLLPCAKTTLPNASVGYPAPKNIGDVSCPLHQHTRIFRFTPLEK